METTIKSHKVTATKVEEVGPLHIHGRMVGPNEGLMLVLEDGQRRVWMTDKSDSTPETGSYFVTDDIVGVSFILPAAKFSALCKAS
jgi:hypothetical protein